MKHLFDLQEFFSQEFSFSKWKIKILKWKIGIILKTLKKYFKKLF